MMPPKGSGGGDSKAAVAARKSFLSLEYYRPAAEELTRTLKKYLPKDATVIDAGCGEGYYTSMIAESGYSVSGVDISKFAVEAAAKKAVASGIENGFFCVGSIFELPFFDRSADAVVNIFAPCSEAEFCRVLRPCGILAVMHAGIDHLMGLKKAIYDTARENDARNDLPKDMVLLEERRVKFEITVDGSENLQNLFAMTPYYWKTSISDGEKLKRLQSLDTVVDMIISIYKKV